MKKIILFVMFLTLSVTLFSQQINPSPALTKQDYLQKSKKQKTAAWILLGGGAAFTITGYAISSSFDEQELVNIYNTGRTSNSFNTGVVFFVTGAAAMLGSIPLFIAASKNKRKAMSLSFKKEMIPQLQNGGFVNRSVPSLSLKISL